MCRFGESFDCLVPFHCPSCVCSFKLSHHRDASQQTLQGLELTSQASTHTQTLPTFLDGAHVRNPRGACRGQVRGTRRPHARSPASRQVAAVTSSLPPPPLPSPERASSRSSPARPTDRNRRCGRDALGDSVPARVLPFTYGIFASCLRVCSRPCPVSNAVRLFRVDVGMDVDVRSREALGRDLEGPMVGPRLARREGSMQATATATAMNISMRRSCRLRGVSSTGDTLMGSDVSSVGMRGRGGVVSCRVVSCECATVWGIKFREGKVAAR